ncbi:SPOR domain-containing protein [Acidibrevibacterium fodinaquatile]|uniref:SPOR domain-containing protein n=1 Tax=Acidibrevibacterium fodinaquatile TaxID=1969806 RepID=UPI000E0CCF4D|nr:SPOR domain-containing protein [Acidibrevibacterium fodinaquatile]
MRAAILIVFANISAFSLGVVMGVWLLAAHPGWMASPLPTPTLPTPTLPTPAPRVSPSALSAPAPSLAPAAGLVGAEAAERPDAASPAPNAQAAPPTPAALPLPGAASSATLAANQVAAPSPPPAAPAPLPRADTAPPAPGTSAERRAPPSAKEATPAAAGAGRNSRYLLQAGAFQDEANATRLAAELKRFGYKATITPATFGARTLLLVRINGFGDRAAVAETAAAIRKRIGIPVLIVRAAP